MDKKIIYLVAALAILAVIIGGWKFFLSFAIAIIIVMLVGEAQVKTLLKWLYHQAKQLWQEVRPDMDDNWDKIQDSFCSLVDDNKANIVVIINSKSYLLRPLEVSSVPEDLQKGQKARVVYENSLLGGSAKIVTPAHSYDVLS